MNQPSVFKIEISSNKPLTEAQKERLRSKVYAMLTQEELADEFFAADDVDDVPNLIRVS